MLTSKKSIRRGHTFDIHPLATSLPENKRPQYENQLITQYGLKLLYKIQIT